MLLRLRSGGGARTTPDGSAEVEARFVLSSNHTLRAFLEAFRCARPGDVMALFEAEGITTVSRAVVAVARGRAFPTILSKFRARAGFWTRRFF